MKQLIKERTSNTQTNPVTIPGQRPSNDAWTQLESELFPILWQQHERVSLFIKSKHGEIGRRLDQIERQLRQLDRRAPSQIYNTQPIQQTRKYARLVQDVDAVSEDIQSLSQFANTQRLAFKKILKKYRKWTGSGQLELRLNKEILNQRSSFLSPDLNPFLERLSFVTSTLSAVSKRRSSSNGAMGNGPPSPEPEATVTQMHDVSLHGSDLDFDVAFSSLPLGNVAGRATYWIHPDNMVEAEVLLLRHLKHRVSKPPKKRMHFALFDNLRRYVQEQGTTTVGQTEDVEGSVASNAALNILWSAEPDAIAITSDLSPMSTMPKRHRNQIHPVRRVDLPKCLTHQISSKEALNAPSKDAKKSPNRKGASALQDFLGQHRDVKPLAEVHLSRSRFVGVCNSKEIGTWAVLDTDITMSPVDTSSVGISSDPGSDAENLIESPESRPFPHAVLQFRWEFSRTPEIVRAFDNTHLAERVRGFTLETDAVYSICSPEGMPKPLWQPLLERDIRKVPPLRSKRSSRKIRSGSAPFEVTAPSNSGPSSTDGPSDSVFSSAQHQSSATSMMDSGHNTPSTTPPVTPKVTFENPEPFKKKRHPRKPIYTRQEPAQRYWNEFDDGDEHNEDSGYAIYVTPDEPMIFPGMETVSKAFSAMFVSLGKGKTRIVSWLPLMSHDSQIGERRPLLGSKPPSEDLDDSSDSESAAGKSTQHTGRRVGNSRVGSRLISASSVKQRRVRKSREQNIFRTYIAAFLVAYGMLVLSTILKTTGRNKKRIEVDAGVIVGIVAALFCGIGGVSLMVSRKEPLSWLHRAAVVLAFCIVCAGSGYLLALVGSTA